MRKVRITILNSSCRSGYHHDGESYIVNDINPPICSELWHNIYPYVCVLRNGGQLDSDDSKKKSFTCSCPDEGRVKIYGEVIDE